MSFSAAQTRVDIRLIPPRERHPLIFSAFRHLAGGQVMELIAARAAAPDPLDIDKEPS